MNFTINKIIYITWAVIGVPIIFFTYVQWSYEYSLSKGELPFNALPEWLWYLIFLITLISGVIAIYWVTLRKKWMTTALTAIYTIVMFFVLLWIHLYVACSNGDCL